MSKIAIQLKKWFKEKNRDLPWRNHPDPYAVFVSEIMLQQTRASSVIPYFQKWLSQFPTISCLASASIEEVIKCWEGLGYYSRARNLHNAANYLVEHHNGNVPSDRVSLEKIKGLGPYTIGAILSFAFKQKISAIDGNAIRVLSRYFLIEEDIAKSKTITSIREIAEGLLPDHEPWVFNEALIELGATVCIRNPKCYQCPIQNECKAYQLGKEQTLPYNSKKQKIEKIDRLVFIISCEDSFLLKKVESGKIMSDLYEFPYLPFSGTIASPKQLENTVWKKWQLRANFVKALPKEEHSFTRYKASLSPLLFEMRTQKEIKDYIWVQSKKIEELPFSSGHRRIFKSLQKEQF